MAISAWEVRVHGVAGTPTTAMLQSADIEVADAWRPGPNDEAGNPRDVTLWRMAEDVPARRALSWSSLTSGSAKHAFYVLLLPFMLCNVAGWTLPELEAQGTRSRRVCRRVRLVRFAAFAVTVQFATLLTLTVVDIFGRQGLVNGWLAEGEAAQRWQPWAAGATVVLCGLVVAAVAWLTHVRPLRPNPTSVGDDSVPSDPPVDSRVDRTGTADLLTDQQALWNTPAMATLLHQAHVGVLVASVALLVAASSLRSCRLVEAADRLGACRGMSHAAGAALLGALTAGGLAVLAGPVGVWVLSRSSTGHLPSPVGWAVRWGRWVAAASLAAAAFAWAHTPAAFDDARVMPLVRGVLVATMALLLLILLVLWLTRGTGRAGGLLMLAAGVGALYGAGIANTVRTALGDEAMIPSSFAWMALAFIAAACVLAMLGVWRFITAYRDLPVDTPSRAWVALRRFAAAPEGIVRAVGGVGALSAVALIAEFCRRRWWSTKVPPIDEALPWVADAAWTLFALLLACVALVVAEVAAGFARRMARFVLTTAVIIVPLRWLTSPDQPASSEASGWFRTTEPEEVIVWFVVSALAVWLLGALAWHVARMPGVATLAAVAGCAGALLWIGATTFKGEYILVTTALTLPVGLVLTRLRGALRDRDTRKGLAVLWDLATFWPRWFHPLSPPTYSDTAVDGLSKLLRDQLPQQRILLAPHSQGSVIGVAAILHAEQALGPDPEPLEHLAFLTYGSPVGHHYRQMFPAMFSDAAVDRLVQALGGQEVRWRNLWRESDPIAGSMGRPPVDEFSGPDGDGLPDPAGRHHSKYWDEPEWGEATAALLGALEGADDA